ncbi:DEAD/DEAH box helicase [Cryomorpha ignava]|uniref:DEAD/DEAH box helicase n=1 Tax=Cryomorpha ignava TaxID=101383 RepID=A0A7K3WKW2_9FLAO|nr:DEAD/DEAH box helicase [Cryomorpha ignava]NEN22287.1 DEAD/DEAH box helicase [Cryomorpha ignava]
MSNIKNQQEILEKLGISALNEMQHAAQAVIADSKDTVIISPTGTGKTVAFLLPVLEMLNPDLDKVQVVIIVPSRELALQIEQVVRDMGTGFKANAVYGGRSGAKDKIELSHPPAILIATPGRLADHLRRDAIDAASIEILILDEFDKSLEVGFEKELREIMAALPNLKKKILTSATEKTAIPDFLEITTPQYLHFPEEAESKLTLRVIESPGDDKLEGLVNLLKYLGTGNGIIFCNFKDSIQEVSDFLAEAEIRHATFHGSLEQKEREHALIKFRNGTHRLLLATDLAARGIDVPELDFIIHFELPPKADEFTHRNGRTARMHSEGTAYILKSEKRSLPEFIANAETFEIPFAEAPADTLWETLFITGGRKDKISKGDIAGLFFKEGKLEKGELGEIELKQDCAYVAVPHQKAEDMVTTLNNSRLKKKKVRISVLD